MKRPTTIRFNLSGNRIFKEETDIILIEDTGRCLEDYKSEQEELEAEEYFYNNPTTLRDISVLLHACCGQGVMWQLSRELALKLGLDKKDVHMAVESIIGEYAELSQEEASKRWYNKELYIKTQDGMPEEDSE